MRMSFRMLKLFCCVCCTVVLAAGCKAVSEPEVVVVGRTVRKPATASTRTRLNVTPNVRPIAPSLVVPAGEPTLYNLTSPIGGRRPEVGRVYHHVGEPIVVLDVINTPERVGTDCFEFVLAQGEHLTIAVDNSCDYVTGEYLVLGDYEYLGTLTYEVTPCEGDAKNNPIAMGHFRTVRTFKFRGDRGFRGLK